MKTPYFNHHSALLVSYKEIKKKKLMSIENGPVVTKKEKKGAEGLS